MDGGSDDGSTSFPCVCSGCARPLIEATKHEWGKTYRRRPFSMTVVSRKRPVGAPGLKLPNGDIVNINEYATACSRECLQTVALSWPKNDDEAMLSAALARGSSKVQVIDDELIAVQWDDRQHPIPAAPSDVSQDATVDEIKKAYRTLASQHHPDLAGPDAGPDVRQAMRMKFEEITRCRDAMLKVREAAK